MSTKASFRAAARRIERAARELDKTFPSGLRVIGEEIMTDVRASRPGAGVPRDEGTLASTGRVEGGGRGGRARVVLSFGGASAPYALIQHERLDFHHKIGEARYLVRGVERWRPDGSAGMQALRENADAALKAVATRG